MKFADDQASTVRLGVKT